jgi:hypothetical protein
MKQPWFEYHDNDLQMDFFKKNLITNGNCNGLQCANGVFFSNLKPKTLMLIFDNNMKI